MRRLSRQGLMCDRLLLDARYELERVGPTRWQADRISRCDDHLRKLASARAKHEALQRIYAEARKKHRVVRAKLQTRYAAFAAMTRHQANEAASLEERTAALHKVTVRPEHEESRNELLALLDACNDSAHRERTAGNEYCIAHNELRDIVVSCKKLGKECLVLAMRALRLRRLPASARYVNLKVSK